MNKIGERSVQQIKRQPVAQPAVADRELRSIQPLQDVLQDAGAGENNVSSLRLQTRQLTALLDRSGSVCFDLLFHVFAGECGTLDNVRVVFDHLVLDGAHAGNCAAHADELCGLAVYAGFGKFLIDLSDSLFHTAFLDGIIRKEVFRDAVGTQIHAEAVLQLFAVAEDKLCAAAAGVEDDTRQLSRATPARSSA